MKITPVGIAATAASLVLSPGVSSAAGRPVALRVESRSWVDGSAFDTSAFRARCASAGIDLDEASSTTPRLEIRYDETRGSGFSAFGLGNPVAWGTDIGWTLRLTPSSGPTLTLTEQAETPAGLEPAQFHQAARAALDRRPAVALACTAVAAALGDRDQQRRLQAWSVFDRRASAWLAAGRFSPSADDERAMAALASRDFGRLRALGEAAQEPLVLLLENTVVDRAGVGAMPIVDAAQARTVVSAIDLLAALGDDEQTTLTLTTFVNDHVDDRTRETPASEPALTTALRTLGRTGSRFTVPLLEEWGRGDSALAREASAAAAAIRGRVDAAPTLPPVSGATTPSTIDVVMRRAGGYAAQFRRQLSSLVAEETYVQDMRPPMGVISAAGNNAEAVRHRELKSDLLMVRPAERYVEFRDVYEVDGRPVRDRQSRLTDLFLAGKAGSAQQVETIAQESARFNIGNVFRNFNTPTLALLFLEPETSNRFRFRRVDGDRKPALAKDWRFVAPEAGPGDRIWVVEFREVRPRTVIGRYGGGDMPASGHFWIDSVSGRVLASELVIGDPMMQCTINVRYGTETIGGVAVPAEMRERYTNTRDRVVTTGKATYGRVRRFGVATDEVIPPPAPTAP